MEATRRYRLLIYFAALVLCLSVCFAYAEEPQSSQARPDAQQITPARLLFLTAPNRSSFMQPLSNSFVTETAASMDAPAVSATKMDQVSADLHHSRGFLHGLALTRHKPSLILSHPHDGASSLSTGDMQTPESASNDQSE